MKYIKEMSEFLYINEDSKTGIDTSWDDGCGNVITLKGIMEYLDDNDISPIDISPIELENLLIKVKRDPDRVQNADLNYPIVITKLNGKYNRIIDGQHRLVKAITNKEESISSYVMDLDNAPSEYMKMFK